MDTPQNVAKRCVNSIVRDLSDRGGLGNEWDNIDDDIKQEILQEWRNIIAVELGGEAE